MNNVKSKLKKNLFWLRYDRKTKRYSASRYNYHTETFELVKHLYKTDHDLLYRTIDAPINDGWLLLTRLYHMVIERTYGK